MKIVYTNRPYVRDHILNANNGINCELNITVNNVLSKYNLYITRITLISNREYRIEFIDCIGDPAGTVTRADFFTVNKIVDRLDLSSIPSTISITRENSNIHNDIHNDIHNGIHNNIHNKIQDNNYSNNTGYISIIKN